MRLFRRVLVCALFASTPYLIIQPTSAATCDSTCTARIQWYWSARQTQARQWYGWLQGHDPHQLCVKAHESDTAGGYAAVDSSGNYDGAYQDDRRTWDSAAAAAGRPDLIGTDIHTAPWWDQELVNWVLFVERHDQPWGNRCPMP